MNDQRQQNEELKEFVQAAKLQDRSELLIMFLLLCVFAKLNYVRDAWIAIQQPDLTAALISFDEARGGVANNLFAIGVVLIPLVLYFTWLFATIRNARASAGDYDGPAPGTALLHHVLPPFLLIAPYQMMLSLYRWSAGLKGKTADGAGVLVTTLWWGTLWLAIILDAFRRVSVRDGLVEMSYFQLSFIVSASGAVCALSLAWLVWSISKRHRTQK